VLCGFSSHLADLAPASSVKEAGKHRGEAGCGGSGVEGGRVLEQGSAAVLPRHLDGGSEPQAVSNDYIADSLVLCILNASFYASAFLWTWSPH
jgi:hypothetical protein